MELTYAAFRKPKQQFFNAVLPCGGCRKANTILEEFKMQKVVYSVSKVNRDEKLKGVGYLTEGNLLIPATSQKGKAYIRVFEGVTEKCKPVNEQKNEFKGYVDVIYTNVPVFKSVDHDSDENKEGSYEIIDQIETTYYIWFKFVD